MQEASGGTRRVVVASMIFWHDIPDAHELALAPTLLPYTHVQMLLQLQVHHELQLHRVDGDGEAAAPVDGDHTHELYHAFAGLRAHTPRAGGVLTACTAPTA